MSSLDRVAARLEAIAPAIMREHGIPGTAIFVIDGDAEVIRCFGVVDAETRAPIDADTRFQVGSVSKTVTATLVQRLIEQARLDLDAPVRAYLPQLELSEARVSAALTCRHLLAHVAGFEGDLFIDTGDDRDALPRFVGLLREAQQVAPLGRSYSYCNAGYSILGRIVEVLTDLPFEVATRRYVFDPLGMSRTGFAWEPRAPNTASGHVLRDGAPRVVRPWRLFRSFAPAGGIVSSARDLVAYARLHLAERSAGVLTAGSIEAMRRPLYDTTLSPKGVGWTISRAGDLVVASHGGSTVSHIAEFTLVPARRCAFGVLTNSDRGGPLTRAVTRAILDHLGVTAPASPRFVAFAEIDVAEYSGRYGAAIYRVEVGADPEGIWLDAVRSGGMDAHQSPRPEDLPRMRLDFLGADRAVIRNGPFAEQAATFVRDDGGRVQWVRFYGRLTPRVVSGE